jgi:hypothetical protein
MLGYVTGWIKANKKENKKGKMKSVGGKIAKVYVIVVPGHNSNKSVQFLSAISHKSELYRKLLRKFCQFPTYDHNIEEGGVFYVFKRAPAVYYAKDGLAAPVEIYNECCGYHNVATHRSDVSTKTYWRSGKKSIMFGLKLLRHLIEADDSKTTKVMSIYII